MIEILNSFADKWFGWEVSVLWQASLLIAIVWSVDLAIRKWAWPQVRYALWLLVLVKLIAPPTLTSPASIVSSIMAFTEKKVAVQITAPQEIVSAPVTTINTPAEYTPQLSAPVPAVAMDLPPAIAAVPSLSWKVYAMFVWAGGAVFLAGWLALRLRSMRREHFDSGHQELGEQFFETLEAAAVRLNLKRLPQVILTDKVSCPAVFGLRKPVLLMPAAKLRELTHEDTEHILLHELAHIKRGDLFIHAAYMVLQIVYWFNPLLWITRKHLQNLRELCCDATVARVLKDKTYRYRETLLETARQLLAEPVDPGLGLLGLFENSNWLVDRLKWLEKKTWKNAGVRMTTIFIIVCLMATTVLPMAKRLPEKTNGKFVKEVNGCKIELLGINVLDGGPNSWWLPDGSKSECKIETKDANNYSAKYPGYQIAIKIDSITGFDGIRMNVKGQNQQSMLEIKPQPKGVFAYRSHIKPRYKKTNIKVGVLAGQWKTIATHNGYGTTNRKVGRKKVLYSPSIQGDGGKVFITISDDLGYGPGKRVVAVDKQGKEHIGRRTAGLSVDGLHQHTHEFAGTTRDSIKEFQFQTQDYQWVEFKGVSLRPGFVTEVQAEVAVVVNDEKELAAKDTEKSDFKATLANGVTVELVGVCGHQSDGKRWWKPDGSAFEQVPWVVETGEGQYGLIVRLGGDFDLEQRLGDEPTCFPEAGTWYRLWVDDKSGNRINDLLAIVAQAKPEQTTTSLRVGFETDDWKRADEEVITTTRRFERDNVAYISVVYKTADGLRIQAVDVDGEIQIGNISSIFPGPGMDAWHGSHRTYKFDMPLTKIKEFQFLTSPRQWVKFKGVSLRPGFVTEVQVEVAAVVNDEKELATKDTVVIAENFTADLPLSGKIELVSVSEFVGQEKKCWVPDGSELEKPIYPDYYAKEYRRSDGKRVQESPYRQTGFVFRSSKKAVFRIENIEGVEDFKSDWRRSSGFINKDGQHIPDERYYNCYGKFDRTEPTSIRVRLQPDTWVSRASYDGKYVIGRVDPKIKFIESYNIAGGAKIVFKSDYTDVDTKVYAYYYLDEDLNKNWRRARTAYSYARNATSVKGEKVVVADFDVKLENIKEFKVSTRQKDYEYVEFKNIALKPRAEKTKAQILYDKAEEIFHANTSAEDDVKKLRMPEALKLYREAYENTPSDSDLAPWAMKMIGLCYNHMGDREAEIEAYERAIETFPDQHPDTYYYLGFAYKRVGRPKEAIIAFRKCRSICTDRGENSFPYSTAYYDLKKMGFKHWQVVEIDAAKESELEGVVLKALARAELQGEEEKGNVIRYGDVVEILVFELLKEGENAVMKRQVSEDGFISLHGSLKPVKVEGLSIDELREVITQRYKNENILSDPFVEIISHGKESEVQVEGKKPEVVSVNPPSGSKMSLISEIEVVFNQPMIPDLGKIVDTTKGKPQSRSIFAKVKALYNNITYDPEQHRFTIPLILPPDLEGSFELQEFRTTDGVKIEPVVFNYSTGRGIYSAQFQNSFKESKQSNELRDVLNKVKEARLAITSLSETINTTHKTGSGGEVSKSTFKFQGQDQFYVDISEIMDVPFYIGSDGKDCWHYNGRKGKEKLVTSSFDEVAEKNILISDPFGVAQKGVSETIEQLNIEYLGTNLYQDRKHYIIRSWSDNLHEDFIWASAQVAWIDAETYMISQMIKDSGSSILSHQFIYEDINQPIADSEFSPRHITDAERSAPRELDEGHDTRILNVIDASNGRMSVRWGEQGSGGQISSGLN